MACLPVFSSGDTFNPQSRLATRQLSSDTFA
jgi:hypothetical protein